MKKKIAMAVAAGLLLTGGAAYASGQYQNIEVFFQRINVAFNGHTAALPKDSIVYQGSVYVPLRSLGELMGADVSWDDYSQTVNLNFLKDRKGEAYQASTKGLYQYMAMEQNRLLNEMIADFKADDMESMKQVVTDYAALRDLAKNLGDSELSASFDKMQAAVEMLRSGWAAKSVDDYSLAWIIYYTNADSVNKVLKEKITNTTFTFQVNPVNN